MQLNIFCLMIHGLNILHWNAACEKCMSGHTTSLLISFTYHVQSHAINYILSHINISIEKQFKKTHIHSISVVVCNCAFNWVILSLQIWSEILNLGKFTDRVGNEALGYGSYLRSLSLNFFVLFLDGVSQVLFISLFIFNEVHLNLGGVSLTYLYIKLSQNIILFLDSF